MARYTIGQLARAAGLKIETIRYYERIELIPYAERDASGYRRYTEEDLKRLHFIAMAKRHGFTLREIHELLELRVAPRRTCADVRRVAQEKMHDLEVKIAELKHMKKALQQLITNCQSETPASQCPILDAFDYETPAGL
ncbi:MAG: heavy metal-responsive transcriptional regulator [Calditrichaeota bacterium]|nr:MAG: heavy metal-responsive transcriptional regulator [Calditrichota bacterium]